MTMIRKFANSAEVWCYHVSFNRFLVVIFSKKLELGKKYFKNTTLLCANTIIVFLMAGGVRGIAYFSRRIPYTCCCNEGGGVTKIDVILRGGEKMKSSMILKTANQYLVTSFTKFFFKVQIVGPTKNIA